MARDLDIPVEVVPVETVREADGLAMSSRNVYLSDVHRAIAPTIYKTISTVASAIRGGDDPVVAVLAADFTLGYWYKLLLEMEPQCKQTNIKQCK